MTDSALVHAVAGGVGSSLAFGVLYPLDQVRTLLQVDDELAEAAANSGRKGLLASSSLITQKYGKGALWRGIAPVLISMGISNFIYFYFSSHLKTLALKRHRGALPQLQQHVSVAENMAVSSLSGVINVLLTTPLWVANTRIKTAAAPAVPLPDAPPAPPPGGRQDLEGGPEAPLPSTPPATNGVPCTLPQNRKAPGLIGTLCLVYKEDGLAGLWAGTVPSLVLVTNPIIQFVAYDYLKRVLLAARGGGAQAKLQLRAHEAFVLGAIAKALATVLTYPLQLAQSKMRAASRVSQQKKQAGGGLLRCYVATAQCLADVAKQRGVPGLFQGMRAKLWHTVLTSSLMFLGYEKIVQVTVEVLEASEARRNGRVPASP